MSNYRAKSAEEIDSGLRDYLMDALNGEYYVVSSRTTSDDDIVEIRHKDRSKRPLKWFSKPVVKVAVAKRNHDGYMRGYVRFEMHGQKVISPAQLEQIISGDEGMEKDKVIPFNAAAK